MTVSRKHSGLGRGLDALLSDAPMQRLTGRRDDERGPGAATSRASLPLEFLRPNPNQPRRRFDEAAIDELAHSIRARGLLQPILVRPLGPDSYEIVAGERRWRAAQKAQLHEIPVIIRELTDEAAAEIALIENVQRVDLNVVEEARAYQRLVDAYKRSPEEIARAVGKSRSHVVNTIRLLTLVPALFSALEKGAITAGHARALIGAPDQQKLLAIVLAKGLNVRDTESLVRAAQGAGQVPGEAGAAGDAPPPMRTKPGSPAKSSAPGKKDADTRALEADLAAALGMLVAIEHGSRGDGAISVRYRNLDQLDEICRRLTRSGV